MNLELILFAVVSAGFLAAFVLLGAKGRAKAKPMGAAVRAVGGMIQLEWPTFVNGRRLLDDSDYRMIQSNPKLYRLAQQVRGERQKLVLEWIGVLWSDLRKLWRFRRVLVRHGAAVTPAEELKVLRTFACCWALLFAVKLTVRVAGPFAAACMVRQSAKFVGSLSNITAGALARIPAAVWPEVEASWAASAA